jgi:hypothetical protein
MLSNMEGYTNRLTCYARNHHFYVYLTTFDILAEDPHFSEPIQFVNYRTLNIIFNTKILYHDSSIRWYNLQLLQCRLILTTFISEQYAEDLHLCVKFVQK